MINLFECLGYLIGIAIVAGIFLVVMEASDRDG